MPEAYYSTLTFWGSYSLGTEKAVEQKIRFNLRTLCQYHRKESTKVITGSKTHSTERAELQLKPSLQSQPPGSPHCLSAGLFTWQGVNKDARLRWAKGAETVGLMGSQLAWAILKGGWNPAAHW